MNHRGDIMSEIKQVIIIRNDIHMSRSMLASQVAQASLKFIVENNESERGDQIHVTLSADEAAWLSGSFSQTILGIDSKEQLDEIMFKAEMIGVETHPVFSKDKDQNFPQLSCIALGPNDSNLINKLVHKLKPI